MPQPTMTLKPPKAKLSISNPVYGKGRRYAGERQRNDDCGELERCLRAPCNRGPECLRNSQCNGRRYDDLFRVTADVARPFITRSTGDRPASGSSRIDGRGLPRSRSQVHRAESAVKRSPPRHRTGGSEWFRSSLRWCSSSLVGKTSYAGPGRVIQWRRG